MYRVNFFLGLTPAIILRDDACVAALTGGVTFLALVGGVALALVTWALAAVTFFLASVVALAALVLAASAAYLARAIFLSRSASFFLLAAVAADFYLFSLATLSFRAWIAAADFFFSSANAFFSYSAFLEVALALYYSFLTSPKSF